MSEIVRYKGKFKKVEVDDLEKFAKDKMDCELPKFFTSNLEYILENREEEFVFINENLYEIFDIERPEIKESFYLSNEQDNGIIEFDVQFYNSGTHIEDALSICLDNIK